MSATPSPIDRPQTHPQATRAGRPAARESHDWKHLAGTPEFQRLHNGRRRFTLTGMAIETGALLLVMGLSGSRPTRWASRRSAASAGRCCPAPG